MNVFFSGNPAHVATTFLSIHGNSLNKMIKIIKKKSNENSCHWKPICLPIIFGPVPAVRVSGATCLIRYTSIQFIIEIYYSWIMYLLWKQRFCSLMHICAFHRFCLFYLQRLLNYLLFKSFWLRSYRVKVIRNMSCALNIKGKRQRNMKGIPFNQYTIF